MTVHITKKLWCETEGDWVKWILEEGEPDPTTCPNDSAHSVNLDSLTTVSIMGGEPTFDSKGNTHVVVMPGGDSMPGTIVTLNLADKTTWHAGSERVTGKTLIRLTEPGIVPARFSFGIKNVIDTEHGKLSQESVLRAQHPDVDGYRVRVYEDGIEATMDTPLLPVGYMKQDQDFAVRYEEGEVVFHRDVPADAVITADFSKATSSAWSMSPAPGKSTVIRLIELQFGVNTIMTAPVLFEILVGQTVVNQITYNNLMDFVARANGALPVIQKCGGDEFGLLDDVNVMQWDYAKVSAITELVSALGMSARLRIDYDEPMKGDYAIITFYVTEHTTAG